MSASLQTSRFIRTTFFAEAVQVTNENFLAVADWCGGEIRREEKSQRKYIQVPNRQPQSDRQKMSYVGDWVVHSETGFRSYKTSSFKKTFNPAPLGIDEDILHKVYGALLEAGLHGELAIHAMREIGQAGIVFQEKKPVREEDSYEVMGTTVYCDDNYGQALARNGYSEGYPVRSLTEEA
jgi:hypothetical protein